MATVAAIPSRRAPPTSRSDAGRSTLAGLCLMVLLALATRLPFWGHPAADYDEQLYSLIGRHLLAGEWPYVGLWDRKPFGLFAIYAVAHGLLGEGPATYQTAALLACVCGGWLTFRLAARIAPSPVAAFASALYPPLMAIYGSHSGQSEIFLTPCLAAMAHLVLRAGDCAEIGTALRRHALAMMLGGLALQIKYSALPACLLFGGMALADLYRRRLHFVDRAGAAALFVTIGVAPTAGVALVYLIGGHFPDFAFANFSSIRFRGSLPLTITLRRQLLDLAPLAALAAGGCISLRNLPDGAARRWRMGAAWLMAGVVSLFLSTTIYPYYFAVLVPATILVALPLFTLPRTGKLLLAGVTVWAVAVFNPWAKAADAQAERSALDEMARVIGSGCVFVYDGPLALYSLSGSPLPTRFIYPDHLDNALEAAALPVNPEAEVRRIMAARPDAVVTSPQPVTIRNAASARVLALALDDGYHRAGVWQFQHRRIEVYLRDAGSGKPRSSCRNSVSKSSKLPPYVGLMAVTSLSRPGEENGIGKP